MIIDSKQKLLRIVAATTIHTLVLSGCIQVSSERSVRFMKVQKEKIIHANEEVWLRGIGVSKSSNPDYKELARMKVNTVRLLFSYRQFYDTESPNAYKKEGWDWIDSHLKLARQNGIWLILHYAGIEGAQFVPEKDIPYDYSIWKERHLQDRFVRLWRAIAKRYRNEPQIAGYSVFLEPVVSKSKEQWQELAQRTINNIREVDRNHIIFIERIYGENETRREISGIDFAPQDAFIKLKDTGIVYEFYFFERDEYTHQFASWRPDVQKARVYPDPNWIIHYREGSGLKRDFVFDREYLKFYLDRNLEFGRPAKVPMMVWGFGALKGCYQPDRGGMNWLRDVLDLLNESRVHWTLWGYYEGEFAISDNESAKKLLGTALATERAILQ